MNPYIQSLRLRTLPLSISGIILGTGLAAADLGFQIYDLRFWLVFALAICTTLSLQILSNLSNELGDALKGTDSAQQERAAYGLQSGALTEQSIRRMIGLFIGLSVLFGSALVWVALPLWSASFFVFLGLGLLAIIGAMTYTLGKHNYGYKGLGDIGVFLFFGLLSTMGGYYLQTQTMTYQVALCGAAIGLPCVGVLNLNNIRDSRMESARSLHAWVRTAVASIIQLCLSSVWRCSASAGISGRYASHPYGHGIYGLFGVITSAWTNKCPC